MKSKNNSKAFASAFISIVVIGGFFYPLRSESYSAYRWDDFNSSRQFGKVPLGSFSRAESQKETVSLYVGGQGFSQKGGEDEKLVARNTNRLFLSPEVRYFLDSKWGRIGFTASFLGERIKKTVTESNVHSKFDGEAILSYELPYKGIRAGLESGRGFQRLDSFGFLFTGFANYAQLRVQIPNFSQLTLLGLRFETLDPFIAPNRQSKSENQIIGGDLNFLFIPFFKKNQIFGYLYTFPSNANFVQNQFFLFPGFQFQYFGWESQSDLFLSHFRLDLFFSRQVGEIHRKTKAFDEERSSSSSYLAYGSLQFESQTYSISLAGLGTKRTNQLASDRKEDGFLFPNSQPRVLGGYSSFFLFQNFLGTNSAAFLDLGESRRPDYNRNGFQLGGVQFSKQWNANWGSDFFLNGAVTSMGKGAEGIARIRYLFDNEKSYVLASICYARNETREEFWRFYLSAMGSF